MLKAILVQNTAADIAPVTNNIKYRYAMHSILTHPEYGEHFAKASGLDLAKVKELANDPV